MKRICVILCFLHTIAFALPLSEDGAKHGFQVQEANTTFDRINLTLSVQNLNTETLNHAVATLSKLVKSADNCVEVTQKKLEDVDALLPATSADLSVINKTGADSVYVEKERKKLKDRQSQCRLFSIRAKEAIIAYKSAIARLERQETIARDLPIWTIATRWFKQPMHENMIVPAPSTFYHDLFRIIGVYVLGLLGISVIFRLDIMKRLFAWYSLDTRFFCIFAQFVVHFYALFAIGTLYFTTVRADPLLVQGAIALYSLLILFAAMYLMRYFRQTHTHFLRIQRYYHLLRNIITLSLLSLVLVYLCGFHTLAMRLALSSVSTLTIVFITGLIFHAIGKVYVLSSENNKMRDALIYYFGYRQDQVFTEFLIIRTTLQVIVVTVGIYFILQNFDYASRHIESIYTPLLYGIHFPTMVFYPTRIVAGIMFYCFLYLGCRALSTGIIRRQQFDDEEETQVALASILTYVGFTIALIAGLLIAGFNFTGLAIIAGALSVGIGLGLQGIVNNFVCGLILLIEKPIKPGDRINVEGIEGFVKKIRVRSTQIITPAREDIIVPNSDLITRRVTNYMFSDKFCRIHCDVGVAYGSDITHVQNTLLDVANTHEEVIKTGRNKPTVLFRAFGPYELQFQLWCLIKDVNKKMIVQSELNMAIDAAFREHNIVMPFPQQHIRIKMDT